MPIFLIILLFGTAPVLSAQEFLFADPVGYLGMSLEEVLEELGEPASIYPFRGETPLQDTVVFYYPEHVYLYWFEDRVWQVRFDHRYEGPVMGFGFGAKPSEVETVLGGPSYADEVSLVFELDDADFPVRVRVFFDEGGARDIYIYRGDF